MQAEAMQAQADSLRNLVRIKIAGATSARDARICQLSGCQRPAIAVAPATAADSLCADDNDIKAARCALATCAVCQKALPHRASPYSPRRSGVAWREAVCSLRAA